MFFGWQFLVQNYFDLLALLIAKHLNLVFLHTHILPNILFTYHTTWHRHRPCKGHLSVGSPLVVSDKPINNYPKSARVWGGGGGGGGGGLGFRGQGLGFRL